MIEEVGSELAGSTVGIVGYGAIGSRRMIDLMPAGGVLNNCARGSLVDYDAVCHALDAGKLFGTASIVASEVAAFLAGRPLAHCANPQVLAHLH
ncbi:NAD(P)-dependent oxidoreductase [Streptomyces phaeochromogenes]|uniref:NAD(P)-dependent oxidoreductase n=1 Tax=Streptomyces phaeochromogenes TaxID=1923 RepID=UPI00340B09D1